MANNDSTLPIQGQVPPAPVDEGLSDWAKVVQAALMTQMGVTIVGFTGSTVHFKFRNQEFSIHVRRVS